MAYPLPQGYFTRLSVFWKVEYMYCFPRNYQGSRTILFLSNAIFDGYFAEMVNAAGMHEVTSQFLKHYLNDSRVLSFCHSIFNN